ncbi:MAG: M48 family metalloprotease [Acidobacteria bacterium]|nr:M48 family metalloprotease [Acidobacteriota bacterium]
MNSIKTVFLLGLLTGLIVVFGNVFGGRSGMVMALGVAAVMNFVSYWFSDRIVLAMHGAKEIQPIDAPEVFSIVANLTQKAGMPMPRIYYIDGPSPNAFATGRSPDHAATLAGAIMVLAHVAQWGAFLGGYGGRDNDRGPNPIALLVTAILAPIAATLIQLAVSRSREYEADASGATLAGHPDGLASALRKLGQASGRVPPMQTSPAVGHLYIVNAFSGRALMNIFSTHPPLEERIARLLGQR